MNITNKKIEELKPYKNNPRNNDKAVDKVAESIKEFGFKVPMVIDKNNEIITGHTRLKAAIKLGLKEVPCIIADDLNEDQIKAFRLIDNKVSEFATWDESLLKSEMDDILNSSFDKNMTEFGFDSFNSKDDEINKEKFEKNKDKTFESSLDESKYDVNNGDVFKLGNHYLICGDSTKQETYDKLLKGIKADLIFTDPPYGMKKKDIENDNLNNDNLLEFNKLWIPLTFNNLKENGSWYCWGNEEPLMDIYSELLRPMIRENKITFRNLITWDKKSTMGQGSDNFRSYPIASEKCLFVMTGVQGFNTNSDHYYEGFEPIRKYFETEIKKLNENDNTIAHNIGYKDGRTVNHWWNKSQWQMPNDEHIQKLREYGKSKGIDIFSNNSKINKQYEEIKKDFEKEKQKFYESRAYFDNTHDNLMNDVWHFNRTTPEERKLTGGHSTPKPIELCERAIISSSRENEIVLDCFGGSGSTLIACEKTNRKCYMVELDPYYCKVIINRWESITGKKAEKIEEDK